MRVGDLLAPAETLPPERYKSPCEEFEAPELGPFPTDRFSLGRLTESQIMPCMRLLWHLSMVEVPRHADTSFPLLLTLHDYNCKYFPQLLCLSPCGCYVFGVMTIATC